MSSSKNEMKYKATNTFIFLTFTLFGGRNDTFLFLSSNLRTILFNPFTFF